MELIMKDHTAAQFPELIMKDHTAAHLKAHIAHFKAENTKLQRELHQGLNPAHDAILSKIGAGTLRLTLVLGPARCGTTATERLVFTRLGFDGNYNQPGLLGRKPEFDDQLGAREAFLWHRLLEKVLKLEDAAKSRDLTINPITVVVKETCNIVLPGLEHLLFRETNPSVLAVVRSPFLQLESRLGCILLRIEDAALAKIGVDSNKIDPRDFAIGGDSLINEGTDFSHIDFSDSAVQVPWVQHQKYMKRTRDYSSLGKGFVRLCNLHPLFEDANAQRAIWWHYAVDHPGLITPAMIDAHLHTKLEAMPSLPWPLALALFEWDISWTPFELMYQSFDHADHIKIVVDFSDVQFDAGNLLLEAAREKLPCTPSLAGTYDFDLCSDGEGWDQWFLKSCDWDAMQPTEDILPQRRGPMSPAKFPAEVQALIPAACETYIRARAHPAFVAKPPKLCQAAHMADALAHCDPTYAYIRAVKYGDVLKALRDANPDFELYFDCVDAAMKGNDNGSGEVN